MNRSDKWDKRFLYLAHNIASWSKDHRTQVGAVIIGEDRKPISFGYNGFPRGVNDDIAERHDRPDKYLYTEHAERNAIYNAEQSTKGSTIYVTHMPCADCARAIIQKRISRVVVDSANDHNGKTARRFPENYEASLAMLHEAGIILDIVDLD